MWLMTKYGFFSVVEFKGEREYVLVRARVCSHLHDLQERFALHLTGHAIDRTPDADYPFRMKVKRKTFERVMSEYITHEVDYPDFKTAAAAVQGKSSPYLAFLHQVWGLGHHLTNLTVARKSR